MFFSLKNYTKTYSLPELIVAHIRTKWHQLATSSFSVFLRGQTDTQTN